MAAINIPSHVQQDEKLPYAPPAIVYERIITARAGSLAPGQPGDNEAGIQPEDLFGSGG